MLEENWYSISVVLISYNILVLYVFNVGFDFLFLLFMLIFFMRFVSFWFEGFCFRDFMIVFNLLLDIVLDLFLLNNWNVFLNFIV